jgi:hypothetical protein
MNFQITFFIFHVLIVSAALYVAATLIKRAPFYTLISAYIPLIIFGVSAITFTIWESIVLKSFTAAISGALIQAAISTGFDVLGYEGVAQFIKKGLNAGQAAKDEISK